MFKINHSGLSSPESESVLSAEPPATDPYGRWCGRDAPWGAFLSLYGLFYR